MMPIILRIASYVLVAGTAAHFALRVHHLQGEVGRANDRLQFCYDVVQMEHNVILACVETVDASESSVERANIQVNMAIAYARWERELRLLQCAPRRTPLE